MTRLCELRATERAWWSVTESRTSGWTTTVVPARAVNCKIRPSDLVSIFNIQYNNKYLFCCCCDHGWWTIITGEARTRTAHD